jgi:hypothetical protein
MMKLRNQKMILFALLVLLAAFAGCKGESPTAPDPTPGSGGGVPGSGGTTPPVGATVVLTVTNATPLAGSTSTVTATVTQNGQPVANGTAVEFSTSFGSFSLSDPSVASIIRTTTNGVATITLTAPNPGPAVVTAVVNNVSARTTITFQAQQVPPVTPSTSPTITSITPTIGRPAGGETVAINGTNFRAPARVIFDFGNGVTKDAFVVSVTPTQIVVLTPPIDVTTAQQRQATISVIVDAGTATEQRVNSTSNAFTFQAEVLTPSIVTVSPASGPIDGGTRVTIFGDAFQAPVQVFFGSAEAQVVSITFKQLVVISPTGRETNPDASGAATGPIDIRVININSNKTATLTNGFRYTPKVQVTAAGPTDVPFTGGTRVTIDGVGFNDPVAVSLAGFAASPIAVSGTQIVVISPAIAPTSCADVTGPISVTNVDNGDTGIGPQFRFRVPTPSFTGVNPTNPTAGGNVSVSVANSVGGTVFQVGDRSVFPTSSTTVNGITTYTLVVPTNFVFPSGACMLPGGLIGTAPQPLTVGLTVTNPATTCTSTLANALSIQPPSSTCTVAPPAASVTNPGAGCANAGNIVAAGATQGTTTITIANTAAAGSQPLIISAIAVTNQVNGTFGVSPNAPQTIPAGGSRVFTVSVDPTAPGAVSANVHFTTNDANNPDLVVCVTATGT